jgi:hypothetical protein
MDPMPLERIELPLGLSIAPTLTLHPPEIHLALMHGADQVHATAFTLDRRQDKWSQSLVLIAFDLEVDVDLELGELKVHGDVRIPGGSEVATADLVERWAPMLGRVDGKIDAFAPTIDGMETRSVLPVINRIPIEARPRLGTKVGAIAQKAFFADLPDFVFNVCFVVGPAPAGPGAYTDPESPWFNVFMGYYQIDCPKTQWSRPFAYQPCARGALEVSLDEVLRVGKADWNYLSNWMYGVPEGAITALDGLPPDRHTSALGKHAIGDREWDLVDLDGVRVVSAYPGQGDLVHNSVLSPLWRVIIGEPTIRDDHPESFPATLMRGRFFMSFSEDDAAFHTHLFGGTVNKAFDGDENEAFLARQMKACEAVIADKYGHLGFPRRVTG